MSELKHIEKYSMGPKKKEYEEYEFGGPVGVAAIMLFSHSLILYVWMGFEFYGGALPIAPLAELWGHVRDSAWPSWFTFKLYFGYFVFQVAIAAIVPGLRVFGLPRSDRPGKDERLEYNCNAIQAWYINLIAHFAVHYFGILDLGDIARNLGPLTIVAILFADAIAIIVFFLCHATNNVHKASGNTLYDFFIGIWLHPRIGPVDLKLFGEIRWSWFILFSLTLSSAVRQWQDHQHLSTPMIFMLCAHFIYANATAKGEEMVVVSFDIVYEKWGWLLIFWNFAGVPFLYCASSVYLYKIPPFEHPVWYTALCFFLLLVGYYIFDTANAQKNSFRMRLKNPDWKPRCSRHFLNSSQFPIFFLTLVMLPDILIPRRTFPQLPWAYLPPTADHLKTEAGSVLLTDGWWKYSRKPHYAGDLMMTLSWGLITGFSSVLPWIYVSFFVGMLFHRRVRDETRCAAKYKKDWDIYTAKVPYAIFPYLY